MKNNILLEQLRQYQGYGQSVTQALDLFLQNIPPQESWLTDSLNENLENLQRHARTVAELACSPVKIGIMGEFSSGKTLLIGSLIGYADAFPVSETPTTGNITAVHLRQSSELQTTRIAKLRVEYLSEQKVKECLRYMLKEAEVRAKAAELASREISLLSSLYPTTIVSCNGILSWCERVWNQTQSLQLRSLLRELVTFVRTYSSYGREICGKSYQIDLATAKKGLRLAASPMNILELSFAQLPPPPPAWQDFTQPPCAADLHNSFSLIRRIDVTVEVSKQVWDLSGLQTTNEFVLLDFPGLGSADSGVRDTFLSLQELQDVQTILLLLNGRYPGGAIASTIRTMLEQDKGQDLKDRIIVGVGRFNQLPLSGSDLRTIDQLLEEPSLSEETILERLPILKLTIASASNLTTQKKNIVLLSQLYGLTKLAELSCCLQVCSPEFLPELEMANKLPEAQWREKWAQLSKMLPNFSILQKQLSDYAADGGISRLRSLITEHVAEHGIKQLVEDTKKAAEALHKEQNHLKIFLEGISSYVPVAENPAFANLRQAIENLIAIYRQFQQDLETQPILHNRNGIAVSDLVKDELTCKIFFDWSEWTLLFDRTKNGTITLTKSESFFDDDLIEDSIPTQSDDFYPPFVQTIQQMQVFARDCIQKAVIDLFAQLSAQVAGEHDRIHSLILPEMEQHIQDKFGKHQLRLFRNLVRAIEPANQWQKLILEHSGLANSGVSINVDDLFPLARRDDKHPKGQVFDWSPDKKFPVPPKPFNHQIAVLRLRDEITASASLHLVQYVSQLSKQVKLSFSRAIKEIIDSLQELLKSKHEPLLRYIATQEESNLNSTPLWLEILSQIATIPCPR